MLQTSTSVRTGLLVAAVLILALLFAVQLSNATPEVLPHADPLGAAGPNWGAGPTTSSAHNLSASDGIETARQRADVLPYGKLGEKSILKMQEHFAKRAEVMFSEVLRMEAVAEESGDLDDMAELMKAFGKWELALAWQRAFDRGDYTLGPPNYGSPGVSFGRVGAFWIDGEKKQALLAIPNSAVAGETTVAQARVEYRRLKSTALGAQLVQFNSLPYEERQRRKGLVDEFVAKAEALREEYEAKGKMLYDHDPALLALRPDPWPVPLSRYLQFDTKGRDPFVLIMSPVFDDVR